MGLWLSPGELGPGPSHFSLSHLSSCPGAWFRVLGPCSHGSPALPDCRVLGSHQQSGEIPEFQVLCVCVCVCVDRRWGKETDT